MSPVAGLPVQWKLDGVGLYFMSSALCTFWRHSHVGDAAHAAGSAVQFAYTWAPSPSYPYMTEQYWLFASQAGSQLVEQAQHPEKDVRASTVARSADAATYGAAPRRWFPRLIGRG